jgi:putative peptide zinc metalloprotease protein
MRITPSALYLLEQVRAGASYDEIARRFSLGGGQPVTAEEVEQAYRSVTDRIERIERRAGSLPPGFWFRVPLIPQGVVQKLVSPLIGTFQPWVAAVLVMLMAAAGLSIFLHGPLTISARSIAAGYLLFAVSLLAHELGHAAACARFGARPSRIGFALYLVYPVFYSDVSAAWELTRRQRVVVDLGGIYFQATIAALYALGYVISRWGPFLPAAAFVAASCLFSLNPFFKFDGYWVVTDALGLVNLAAQTRRLITHGRARLAGGHPQLPWPAGVAVALSIYVSLSLLAWGFFFVVVVPSLLRLVAGYPHLAAVVGHHFLRWPPEWGGAPVLPFLSATLATLILALAAFRLALKVVHLLRPAPLAAG